MKKISKNEYLNFVKDVKSEIQQARIKTTKIINNSLVTLYLQIGKMVSNKQKSSDWGKSIVEQLSNDIRKEFGSLSGFSSRNIWDMKRLYEQYSNHPFLRQLVAEIPWGHNLVILNKITEPNERKYYLEICKQNGWSRNILINQIKSNAYKRHMLSAKQHNFTNTLSSTLAKQADDVMKDEYMLDFLGISKPFKEKELENKMIDKIRDVIIEFGNGFAFIGNQYSVKTPNREYYIDLLFYHRKLKCLVAIELKSGVFKPEYAGKMNFYLNILDDFVREEGENPSIGLILCAEKDNFEIEYSLKRIDKPIGVAEYQLTNKLPEQLKANIPTVHDIKSRLIKKES